MPFRFLIGFLMIVASNLVAVAQDKTPVFRVLSIKVGEDYVTDGDGTNTWAKILQIIDGENMLLGVDNGGTNPRYSVVVWCKFSTKGLAEGRTGFLNGILATNRVTISGTIRYKTKTGGARTVFVLEPTTR